MTRLKNPAVIALTALIKRHGLSYADLRHEIGSRGHISLILSDKRNLTKSHIKKLSTRFGIPEVVFFDQQAAQLFAGHKIKVPTVDLLNPDVEPDPEKMDALLYDVALKANHKAQKAHNTLMDNLQKAVLEAVA